MSEPTPFPGLASATERNGGHTLRGHLPTLESVLAFLMSCDTRSLQVGLLIPPVTTVGLMGMRDGTGVYTPCCTPV